MVKKRLLWQLYPTYLLITLLALISIGWYALSSLQEFYYDRTSMDLEVRARLVERLVADQFSEKDKSRLDSLSKEVGKSASMRVTLIQPTGEVLGDSHEDPARMDNHGDRPEIKESLSGNRGVSVRFSHTLQKKMMYLAIPVKSEGKIIGVVRTSLSITFIDNALRSIEIKIAWGALAVALFAAIVSLGVSRRISRPLELMKKAAEEFAPRRRSRKNSGFRLFGDCRVGRSSQPNGPTAGLPHPRYYRGAQRTRSGTLQYGRGGVLRGCGRALYQYEPGGGAIDWCRY